MNKVCLLTNDVETTSIYHNSLRDATGARVLKEGMPLLLELYAKYNIKSTFFFTGYIADKFPGVVEMILPYGHEVGCHGFTHDPDKAFDVLSLTEQIEHLKKAKQILENISGRKVISFRAPAARVNKDTAIALKETGFEIDSSVASQRFDMFLSFGGIKKLNWLTAPRCAYFTNPNNLWKAGIGPIFEIPISALILPYIGTTLRMSPFLTRSLRSTLVAESRYLNNKPIVFLTHPNEFITEFDELRENHRRTQNYLSYLWRELIRRKLKLKNLGLPGLTIYEKELNYFSKNDFSFLTCKEYYEMHLLAK